MKIMKKCPPGLLCIETLTFGLIIVIIFVLCFLGFQSMHFSQDSGKSSPPPTMETKHPERNIGIGVGLVPPPPLGIGMGMGPGLFPRPNYAYSNAPGDVLMNPYVPPIRDERYLVPEVMIAAPPGRVPVNISTNVGAVNTNYRQVGILTPRNGTSSPSSRILPLMGRPLFVNRDKWQYYTMSDQNNSIKLPIRRNGRSCTNEYGCDKLYTGDTVFVEGYNEAFTVTKYENDVIQYIPFL